MINYLVKKKRKRKKEKKKKQKKINDNNTVVSELMNIWSSLQKYTKS